MLKTKVAEIPISFGSKIIKFCIKIKNFAQMLSEILVAKFQAISLYATKIHINRKRINLSNAKRKNVIWWLTNKIRSFIKQVKWVKNIIFS